MRDMSEIQVSGCEWCGGVAVVKWEGDELEVVYDSDCECKPVGLYTLGGSLVDSTVLVPWHERGENV